MRKEGLVVMNDLGSGQTDLSPEDEICSLIVVDQKSFSQSQMT